MGAKAVSCHCVMVPRATRLSFSCSGHASLRVYSAVSPARPRGCPRHFDFFLRGGSCCLGAWTRSGADFRPRRSPSLQCSGPRCQGRMVRCADQGQGGDTVAHRGSCSTAMWPRSTQPLGSPAGSPLLPATPTPSPHCGPLLFLLWPGLALRLSLHSSGPPSVPEAWLHPEPQPPPISDRIVCPHTAAPSSLTCFPQLPSAVLHRRHGCRLLPSPGPGPPWTSGPPPS